MWGGYPQEASYQNAAKRRRVRHRAHVAQRGARRRRLAWKWGLQQGYLKFNTGFNTSQLQNSSTPEAFTHDFSMYQSGIGFKCPYSNRPLKPSTP
jgi:hypothetical protein